MAVPRQRNVNILVVESDPDDAQLFRDSFADSESVNQVYVTSSGNDALDYVYQRGEHDTAPRPNLVVLDPQLPESRPSGYDVLSELKSEPKLSQIPVIVLTSSDAETDLLRSYNLHANAYLRKPDDPDSFDELIDSFKRFWLSAVRLPPA
ncbi:response regulator [Halobacteria archaeon AArc-m2/3/4]|uniref:Response regulator n=1 Tax=Natronoglomus mannanivorans TaxID=2979990 RepID=A0AAP3E1B9_9EURY|nr:response regulator [Halobacteria archaeon AArc-xg1-1]MCU4973778.1 response regulator [Halobacteria archaeon AArc-m2/3/4]